MEVYIVLFIVLGLMVLSNFALTAKQARTKHYSRNHIKFLYAVDSLYAVLVFGMIGYVSIN